MSDDFTPSQSPTPIADDRSIYLLLGEMRGDIKAILVAQKRIHDDLESLESKTNEKLKEMHDRVSTLEHAKSQVVAAAAVVGAIISVVYSTLTNIWETMF